METTTNAGANPAKRLTDAELSEIAEVMAEKLLEVEALRNKRYTSTAEQRRMQSMQEDVFGLAHAYVAEREVRQREIAGGCMCPPGGALVDCPVHGDEARGESSATSAAAGQADTEPPEEDDGGDGRDDQADEDEAGETEAPEPEAPRGKRGPRLPQAPGSRPKKPRAPRR
jgi:hypothetical protein